jgi:hypothetical protein
MNNDDNREAIKQLDELIEAYSRRLHKLQIRVAIEGRDSRPQDLNEIEDIEKKLSELREQCALLLSKRTKVSPDQASEFQETRKALNTKDIEPFEIKAAFANREAELSNILSPLGKPFIFLSAPAGYGKTYLLDEVKRRLESNDKERWLVIRHACHPDDSDTTVLESLARQIGYMETEPVRTLDKFLMQVNRAMGQIQANNLMLQFDSLEKWNQHDSEGVKWLPSAQFVQGPLVTVLYEAMRHGGKNCKVIFAGRYIGYAVEGFRLPYLEINLSPFGLDVIRMFIQETLHRFEEVRSTRLGYSFQDIEYLAEEILDITGGHPKAVIRLIQDIGESEFAVDLAYYFRDDHKKRLFNNFVAKEIPELFNGVSPSLQESFQTLSIFRGFNGDTLGALIEEGSIPGISHADGWVLYTRMLGTHLVDPDTPLAHDRILQRVLDARMRFDDADKYGRLHQFAARLYDNWLQGKDHKGGELDSGIPFGTDQIRFMLESLYHTCRSYKGETVCAELDTKKKLYATQLRYQGGLAQGRRALRKELEKDEHLPSLLRRILGQEGYGVFLSNITNDT